MANQNNFNSTVQSLFNGMNNFVKSKTVVGEAVKVGDTTIIPLIDVTFGMGVGAGSEDKRNKGNGGIGGKMVPSAVLVIRDGNVKLVNVKKQDAMTKILDLVPDIMEKATGKRPGGKKNKDEELVKDIEDAIKKSVDDNEGEF